MINEQVKGYLDTSGGSASKVGQQIEKSHDKQVGRGITSSGKQVPLEIGEEKESYSEVSVEGDTDASKRANAIGNEEAKKKEQLEQD